MSTSCQICQPYPHKLHQHYNIEYVKQRFIPTYSHTNIFQQQPINLHTRYTPTFHSTALNTQGYHSVAKQQGKASRVEKDEHVVYKNVSVQRKQQQLNPLTARNYEDRSGRNWYDTSKQELLESLCFTQRYPKDRKLADLSSNPIFGGTFMQVSKQPVQKVNHEPEKQAQVQQNHPNQEKKQVNEPLEKQPQTNLIQMGQKGTKRLQKQQKQTIQKKQSVKISPKITKNQVSKQKNAKKVNTQKYLIKDEVVNNSRGKKLQKNMVIGSTPAFALIKKGKA